MSLPFNNNLTSIIINNSYNNALYYFNPGSLPTNLKSFNITSDSNYFINLSYFNFDLFLNI